MLLPMALLRSSRDEHRRLGPPSRLPTLDLPQPTLGRPNLWRRLLALLEPAPARSRRERRAVVLPLRRRGA